MAPPAPGSLRRVSVCIPTRNRGSSIIPALASLMNLDHDSFEVVVVDQSSDDRSHLAFLQTVGDDPRFTWLRSATAGKSAACNVALSHARGAITAFTDDDCEAPRDWLTAIEEAFTEHPGVAMVCGGVTAAAHDPARGAIPTFTPERTRLLRSPWLAFRANGIGANVSFRPRCSASPGASTRC